MKEIKQKLNFSDYDFEVDGKIISKVYVTYYLNEDEVVDYHNGIRGEIKYRPYISLCISGMDNNDKEVWFSFMMNIGLDKLNEFSKEPTNITNYVSLGEAFIKKADNEDATWLDFEFPKNDFNDIYRNLSSIWISKIDTNKFIFKVCVPSERLFSYFHVDFDKK